MCGGTNTTPVYEYDQDGLSPRVRGNRTYPALARRLDGTIPACAGEPNLRCNRDLYSRDYPRVCGGTSDMRLQTKASEGLSPRVRGNRRRMWWWRTISGTIPACAGEPEQWEALPPRSRDYPRVCGGTPTWTDRQGSFLGLSPRVRGNLAIFALIAIASGTIPACAGEPWHRDVRGDQPRDYPRVCGGTPHTVINSSEAGGLSPRVRGNQLFDGGALEPSGTIPACAGEPRASRLCQS